MSRGALLGAVTVGKNLHDGLVGVRAPDMAPQMIKSVSRPRWFEISSKKESLSPHRSTQFEPTERLSSKSLRHLGESKYMVNMNLLHDLSKARGGRSDSVAPNHYRAISGCCPDSSRSCPSPFSLLGARDSPRRGDSKATHALQNQHYHMALIDRVHDVDRVITFLDDKVDGLRKVQRLKDGVTSTRWLQPSNEPPKPKSIDQDSRRVYRLQGSVVKRSSSMIEDYKKSAGFEMGLVRIGQVSLEYDYLLALAKFRARYLDLKVKEEPFKKLRKDVNVLMVKSSLSVTRRRLRRVE
ncbi:hypothetical protein BHM03_00042243 [Ensete ventricosum]|nr:hypothetical protein BHM03_00042243 [Ensete ventricosum]